MFLCRPQLGEWLDFTLQCRDENRTPSMPEDPPMLRIRRASDNVTVYNREIPILEKQGVAIGTFAARVFLGSAFVVGAYNVELAYTVGAFTEIELRTFTIVGGGNPKGQVIGMHFYRRPNRSNLVYQTESGTILRGSNPKIT